MTTYTQLRLKRIPLDETTYETERVMAMKFMQMYCETNGLGQVAAEALRDTANWQVRQAVAGGEQRTMFLARQHGFSDGAQSYINDIYRIGDHDHLAPVTLLTERMKQN